MAHNPTANNQKILPKKSILGNINVKKSLLSTKKDGKRGQHITNNPAGHSHGGRAGNSK